MMACIQAAHWFQPEVFAIAPLIAIKHNTDCSCSRLYPHTTVTEAFSRKCTWTQNNAHSLVVLKQTRSLIHTISCRDSCRRRIRSKAILHISLNFLHLITQKKKKGKIENIFYFTHCSLKGGKNDSVLLLTVMHFTSQWKVSSMRENGQQAYY